MKPLPRRSARTQRTEAFPSVRRLQYVGDEYRERMASVRDGTDTHVVVATNENVKDMIQSYAFTCNRRVVLVEDGHSLHGLDLAPFVQDHVRCQQLSFREVLLYGEVMETLLTVHVPAKEEVQYFVKYLLYECCCNVIYCNLSHITLTFRLQTLKMTVKNYLTAHEQVATERPPMNIIDICAAEWENPLFKVPTCVQAASTSHQQLQDYELPTAMDPRFEYINVSINKTECGLLAPTYIVPYVYCLFIYRVNVSSYVLLSEDGSVVDFHQDFSSTSVFYMVLKGEKVFYLVRPSQRNVEKFKVWSDWTVLDKSNKTDRTER